MAPFNRSGRQRITPKLTYKGRAIQARALVWHLSRGDSADDDDLVWGEVYETASPRVLAALDEIGGYRPRQARSQPHLRVL